jgi:hypothetical protein
VDRRTSIHCISFALLPLVFPTNVALRVFKTPQIVINNSTFNFRGFHFRRDPSKNWRMPLFAASTRYSLVKGERIVRSVLTAWLRDLLSKSLGGLYLSSYTSLSHFSHMGQKHQVIIITVLAVSFFKKKIIIINYIYVNK